jgi:hypothetical protein
MIKVNINDEWLQDVELIKYNYKNSTWKVYYEGTDKVAYGKIQDIKLVKDEVENLSYLNQVIETSYQPRYPGDVSRIRKVAKSKGYYLTTKQAEKVWQLYSNSMSAGWIRLPDDDQELWNIIS